MNFNTPFNCYKGKTVIITGHTGFKGSWLTAWLKKLGANVVGISLEPSTVPSHFTVANIKNNITDIRENICNLSSLGSIFSEINPDFIFHLAAQALVKKSVLDPVATWETNVIGSVCVLDALRRIKKKCSVIMITSDKCYENLEWTWGYRENDRLGGSDPYSASKAAAELAINSYVKSFYADNNSLTRIASARAGNVIGGGDWSGDRIIPDCVSSWAQSKIVKLRNPNSTRPWQHVLEPLSGYLLLGYYLNESLEFHGEAFNFGPNSLQSKTVLELVKEMSKYWSNVKWEIEPLTESGVESGLLKLNCDKSHELLGWHSVLNFNETVEMTAEWYRSYYEDPGNIEEISNNQINSFMLMAIQRGNKWTI